MKFTVTGSSRENGARMTLEIDANSRAAAEKKAASAGMLVARVDQSGEDSAAPRPPVTVYKSGRAGKILPLIVLAAVAAGAWYYYTHIVHH